MKTSLGLLGLSLTMCVLPAPAAFNSPSPPGDAKAMREDLAHSASVAMAKADRLDLARGAASATAVQDAEKDIAGVQDHMPLPDESGMADGDAAPQKPKAAADAKPVPALPRKEFCERLAESAQQHDLPIALFARLIWQESRFRPEAISPVGAQGVAQFMPDVAAEVGLKNPFDPAQALPAAARFLRGLFERFGSLGLAAAAYNAGSGRVGDWLSNGRKLPEETRNYVRMVTGRDAEEWRAAKVKDLALRLPAGMPCRHVGIFVSVEREAEEAMARARMEAKRARAEAIRIARAAGAGRKSFARATRMAAARRAGRAAHPPSLRLASRK